MMESAAFFALCGAFLLAFRDILGRFGVRGIDPIVGTAVSALLGLPVLVIISALAGDFGRPLPDRAWPLLSVALAGILRITAARTLLFASTQFIGAARGGTLGTTSTFFSIALGMIFLGESLTLSRGAGAALVIAGCVFMAQSRGGRGSPERPARYLEGTVLALMSALAFGASSVLVRPAVNAFASPNQANLYANAFAVIAFLPIAWGRLSRAKMKDWQPRTWVLLMLAGSAASLGVTFVYLALARAPVVFVAPLSQARPLFLVVLSWLFFQAHEAVNRRVAFGAAAIFAGTVLLIIYR